MYIHTDVYTHVHNNVFLNVRLTYIVCTIHYVCDCAVDLNVSYRTGCKPFVEVFQDGERVFTSASHETMEQIQSFSSESGGVLVPLGTKVRGNIQVIIHHIRAIPIARKANLVSYIYPIVVSSCVHVYSTKYIGDIMGKLQTY